ncbi:MAG: hypothetical protein QG590_1412, partial [Pseudomonadota bacterium]|nr:hypothetical protein [Pseudomonadota bacterium]
MGETGVDPDGQPGFAKHAGKIADTQWRRGDGAGDGVGDA